MARRGKFVREEWRKCPKTNKLVSPDICRRCDDKISCEARPIERKVRRR